MKNFQKLSKEELKSINGGTGNCATYPLCGSEEVTYYGRNSCGWYLYKTSTNSICMEYAA
ncbi:bacteriocin [Flavobacterium sp. FlaQc-51]|jgi:bacteriocin-like protein|uniref:bacteriocin-like protein n=1 Tax=unclassified Flavobacterium TaxID=196869 RepID=UPI000A6648FD|nr:bacteriocin [Flavobacterium sp. Leaf82]